MHSDPFEREVAGLFAAAPEFEDNQAFADQVLQRLADYEQVRGRVLMGVGGVASVVAAALVARSNLWSDIGQWAARSDDLGAAAANAPLAVWYVLAAALAAGAWMLSRTSIAR